MKKMVLLISIIMSVLCAHEQELMLAARSLDVQKVQQLVDKGIKELTLPEIIGLIHELDNIVDSYNKVPNLMTSAGKLAAGIVFFVPAGRFIDKSYQFNEDHGDSFRTLWGRFFTGHPVKILTKGATFHVPHLPLIATSGGILTLSSYFIYDASHDIFVKLQDKSKYEKALTIVKVLKKAITEKYTSESCN